MFAVFVCISPTTTNTCMEKIHFVYMAVFVQSAVMNFLRNLSIPIRPVSIQTPKEVLEMSRAAAETTATVSAKQQTTNYTSKTEYVMQDMSF